MEGKKWKKQGGLFKKHHLEKASITGAGVLNSSEQAFESVTGVIFGSVALKGTIEFTGCSNKTKGKCANVLL